MCLSGHVHSALCVRETLTCVLITLEMDRPYSPAVYICQTQPFALVGSGRVGGSGDEPGLCIIKEAEVHE